MDFCNRFPLRNIFLDIVSQFDYLWETFRRNTIFRRNTMRCSMFDIIPTASGQMRSILHGVSIDKETSLCSKEISGMEMPQTNHSPYFCILEIRRSFLVPKGGMNTSSSWGHVFSWGKARIGSHELMERLQARLLPAKPQPFQNADLFRGFLDDSNSQMPE